MKLTFIQIWLCFGLLIGATPLHSAETSGQTFIELNTARNAQPASLTTHTAKTSVLRNQRIKFHTEALNDESSAFKNPTPRFMNQKRSKTLLPLFKNRTHDLHIERTEENGDTKTVYGSIDNIENSHVVLTVTSNVLAGTIHAPGYPNTRIRPLNNGEALVEELSEQTTPKCIQAPLRSKIKKSTANDLASGVIGPTNVPTNWMYQTPNGTINIDVLAVYTSAAKQGAGSAANIASQIQQSIQEANQVCINSGINIHFTLVHTDEVAYQETGNFSLDLDRLASKTDGYMDGVHTLRNTYQADLVMLVSQKYTDAAGIGYLMDTFDLAQEDAGFTVVALDYLVGYYVAIHEFGHNFGCAHDQANASGPGIEPFSYGYRFKAWTPIPGRPGTYSFETYHTVMAYEPGAIIPYFSNPTFKYLGAAMGTIGNTLNGEAMTDNTMTMIDTAPYVANFRGPTSLVTITPITASARENDKTVTFTLTRSGNTAMPASVRLITTNQTDNYGLSPETTAVAGQDYVPIDTIIYFAAGVKTKTVSINLLQDTKSERTKTVPIALIPQLNAILAANSDPAIIIYDDDPTFIATKTAFENQVAEDQKYAYFTIYRTGNVDAKAYVQYTTVDLTAKANVDYRPVSGMISFQSKEDEVRIKVPIIATNSPNTSRQFKLVISKPTGATLGTPTEATMTILPVATYIGWATNKYEVLEDAGKVTLTLNRKGRTDLEQTLHIKTSNGTAFDMGNPPNYVRFDQDVTFPAGSSNKTIEIAINRNVYAERNFSVQISNLPAQTFPWNFTTATVNIIDIDSNYTFERPYYSHLQAAAGATNMPITVVRTTGTRLAGKIEVVIEDYVSGAGTDYILANNTLEFAEGQTKATLNLQLIPAKPGTPQRTFTIRLKNDSARFIWADLAAVPGPKPTISLKTVINQQTRKPELQIVTSHNMEVTVYASADLKHWGYFYEMYCRAGITTVAIPEDLNEQAAFFNTFN